MSFPLYDYTILPCDSERVRQWAPKFIDFRLTALKSAPRNSTSSHELEAAIPEQEWVLNLSDAATPLWDREWAGILCMHGPLYEHPAADNCTTSTWYLGSGFVVPDHRGSRVMFDLFHFGVQQARILDLKQHNQRGFQTAQCRTRVQVIARADEPKVINYYRTGGLEITEHLTLGEFSKRGPNLLYKLDHLAMPIVVMEKYVEHEVAIISRL
ncbi:unnamed protein product [Penicillium manginii]